MNFVHRFLMLASYITSPGFLWYFSHAFLCCVNCIWDYRLISINVRDEDDSYQSANHMYKIFGSHCVFLLIFSGDQNKGAFIAKWWRPSCDRIAWWMKLVTIMMVIILLNAAPWSMWVHLSQVAVWLFVLIICFLWIECNCYSANTHDWSLYYSTHILQAEYRYYIREKYINISL